MVVILLLAFLGQSSIAGCGNSAVGARGHRATFEARHPEVTTGQLMKLAIRENSDGGFHRDSEHYYRGHQ